MTSAHQGSDTVAVWLSSADKVPKKPMEAVFISDLHLHPVDKNISNRFACFIAWATHNTRAVYILGDFFHVWAGDDAIDAWSSSIINQLKYLTSQGVAVYFMHGNRDFLLGPRFAKAANVKMLTEPTVITLGGMRILLVHGDRYCTKDRGHQWLRWLTRNRFFPVLFLKIPLGLRKKLVHSIRHRSEYNRNKLPEKLAIVSAAMLNEMQAFNVQTLIHGHIHNSGLTIHKHQGAYYKQYVLSDWDDNPMLMCYDNANGLFFKRFPETQHASQ
ncbi:UDP-2,3-diacylglucosamine diphosphatase [Legionella septentrionalis]|nr:UDP-2,3-diacylglucosamine diphosphatase [Legionella septentrionalis]